MCNERICVLQRVKHEKRDRFLAATIRAKAHVETDIGERSDARKRGVENLYVRSIWGRSAHRHRVLHCAVVKMLIFFRAQAISSFSICCDAYKQKKNVIAPWRHHIFEAITGKKSINEWKKRKFTHARERDRICSYIHKYIMYTLSARSFLPANSLRCCYCFFFFHFFLFPWVLLRLCWLCIISFDYCYCFESQHSIIPTQ